ncbi:PGPGW domain-containing protein, partial [Nocardioides sp.]|uniref:PGPGW domain-containing protein n=1 Tax=Nocardioides sp. TaxID=35761 RepID=UPI0027353B1B
MKTAKRIGVEAVGWVLVVVGIAALVLPGPGLLMIFGGLAILSQQYEWAERRLDPIKYRALKGAAESVETYPRLCASL